tara:strand:+ start:215 stop:952 length:738 start_codon:yes stop_codon:yes gene_type:complete
MFRGRGVLNQFLCVNRNIKLLVFDMAGTTVNENGLVYKTLFDTIKDGGIDIEEKEIKNWHGINKSEVIRHFVNNRYDGYKSNEDMVMSLNKNFNSSIRECYFDKESPLELIHPNLPDTFEKLRNSGLKIALNTGYPIDIQEKIIENLDMSDMIDGYISSEQVNYGRPYPYMIYRLMELFSIKNSNEVIKIGDTPSDIEEGKNAKCYMSVGVMSGASNMDTYEKTNVDMVIPNANCIELLRNIYIK